MTTQKRGTPPLAREALPVRKPTKRSPGTVYHAPEKKSSEPGLFTFLVGLVLGTMAGLLICAVIVCSIDTAEHRIRSSQHRREVGAVVMMEGGR